MQEMWVCRCSDVPRQVSLLSHEDFFVWRLFLGHNCSIEERLDVKMF